MVEFYSQADAFADPFSQSFSWIDTMCDALESMVMTHERLGEVKLEGISKRVGHGLMDRKRVKNTHKRNIVSKPFG